RAAVAGRRARPPAPRPPGGGARPPATARRGGGCSGQGAGYGLSRRSSLLYLLSLRLWGEQAGDVLEGGGVLEQRLRVLVQDAEALGVPHVHVLRLRLDYRAHLLHLRREPRGEVGGAAVGVEG